MTLVGYRSGDGPAGAGENRARSENCAGQQARCRADRADVDDTLPWTSVQKRIEDGSYA